MATLEELCKFLVTYDMTTLFFEYIAYRITLQAKDPPKPPKWVSEAVAS